MAGWRWLFPSFSWQGLLSIGLDCLVILAFFSILDSIQVQVDKTNRILALTPIPLREFEQVEGLILLPPWGIKNPERVNFNDEFLDPTSRMRSIFFPNIDAIDPRVPVNDTSHFYYPGNKWLDTDGYPIRAHGGCILFDGKSETYYWYGEYKDGPTYKAEETGTARVDFNGVGCYSSKNLWAWTFEGIVLSAEEMDEAHDLHKMKVVERPKVIHNEKTDKYVMWMHVDDSTYTKASAGVAVSHSPIGPFQYLHSVRPNGFDSRDLTVFKDENGISYLIYSSINNKEIHISPLTEDYVDVTNETWRVLVGQHREAPTLFKHNGIYYMVTSGGVSGCAATEALVHEAESAFRAATFFAQGSFVLPMPGGAHGSFIFTADRWNPTDLKDSRHVWLPLTVTSRDLIWNRGLPLWSRVSVFWNEKWRIPVRENEERHYVSETIDW